MNPPIDETARGRVINRVCAKTTGQAWYDHVLAPEGGQYLAHHCGGFGN
jgi:hypothetical protein